MSQKIISTENIDDFNDSNDDKNSNDLNYFFNEILFEDPYFGPQTRMSAGENLGIEFYQYEDSSLKTSSLLNASSNNIISDSSFHSSTPFYNLTP
jgi:hypothetical protein